MNRSLIAAFAAVSFLAPAPLFAGEAASDQRIASLEAEARAGDLGALVALEQMRLSAEADAPSLDDIVDIENARAEEGDPVAAWRLARRYDDGENIDADAGDFIRWLTIAAEADASGFPQAKDAAFRLCELLGRGEVGAPDAKEAAGWCHRAADAGHAGAALVLAQMRTKNDG